MSTGIQDRRKDPRGALWFGIAAGPLAWTVHLIAGSVLVPYACGSWGHASLHVLTAGTASVTVLAGAAAIAGGRGQMEAQTPPSPAPATPPPPASPLPPAAAPRRSPLDRLLSLMLGQRQIPRTAPSGSPEAWPEPSAAARSARRKFMSRFGFLLSAISLALILVEAGGNFVPPLCKPL
jgi:hypothetical protein